MTHLISAQTRMEAWTRATRYLLSEPDRSALNLILAVEEPSLQTAADRRLQSALDELYRAADMNPTHTVAETIFPGWLYRRRGMTGVFEEYPKQYEAIKAAHPSSWGIYAYRLIHRVRDGKAFNPLKDLIQTMKDEHKRKHGSTFKSRYELGLLEIESDIPVFEVGDARRRRGLPCLTHLSFKLLKGRVHLTALYRSHEYQYKVPGNLLGLARLQDAVASEVGAKPGTLTAISTLAFFEGSTKALRALVGAVESK